VTGGADRVEALVEGAHAAGGDVEPPAGELGVQERHELGGVDGGLVAVAVRAHGRPAVGVVEQW
jgi:hypothetical protein